MVKVKFFEHDKAGRTVAIQFYGGNWLMVKWDELPHNIQWLLVELSIGDASVNVDAIPWLEDWQNGK